MKLKQVGFPAFVLCVAPLLRGQQADPLQRQLQELKQEYEETRRTLEQRITALERKIAEQNETQAQMKKATVSAAELAAKGAQELASGESPQVGAAFQGQLPSKPSYELLREADQKIVKLQEQVNSFEFHGYFRSGYGLNG